MTTEARFKLALREMLASKPLGEINVTTLCDKLGVHRQTFYYHYQDVYDLLESIFLNESIPTFDKAPDIPSALECICHYIKDNYKLFCSTAQSSADDLVSNFIFNKVITKMITLYSHNQDGLSKISYRSVARRFSNAISYELTTYLKTEEMETNKFLKISLRYCDAAYKNLYPALVHLTKDEKKR